MAWPSPRWQALRHGKADPREAFAADARPGRAVAALGVVSDAGHARCGWLAAELGGHGIARLCSSLEPKALKTAALVGVELGLPVEPYDGLHENDRTGLGFLAEDELLRRLQAFFARPAEAIMGQETAEAALARFAAAIRRIVAETTDANLAVVTHGTVLTLLVACYNAVEPFAFWGALTTPSYVVLDSQTLALAGPAVTFPKSREARLA